MKLKDITENFGYIHTASKRGLNPIFFAYMLPIPDFFFITVLKWRIRFYSNPTQVLSICVTKSETYLLFYKNNGDLNGHVIFHQIVTSMR